MAKTPVRAPDTPAVVVGTDIITTTMDIIASMGKGPDMVALEALAPAMVVVVDREDMALVPEDMVAGSGKDYVDMGF